MKSMNGTRDAAQNWGSTYSEFMKSVGFQPGKSSPCVFWHKEKELRCVVHGDEFTVLGWEKQLELVLGQDKGEVPIKAQRKIRTWVIGHEEHQNIEQDSRVE